MEAEDDAIKGVKARSVLWYLTFIGFAVNYMIRININIAIVDMISSEYRGNKGVVISECVTIVNATNATFYQVSDDDEVDVKKYVSMERRLLDYLGVCCDVNEKNKIIYSAILGRVRARRV